MVLSTIINWNSPVSVLRVLVVFFFQFQYNILQANNGDPDQMLRSVTSCLGLHYLPMPHKKDASHIWVNGTISTVAPC